MTTLRIPVKRNEGLEVTDWTMSDQNVFVYYSTDNPDILNLNRIYLITLSSENLQNGIDISLVQDQRDREVFYHP